MSKDNISSILTKSSSNTAKSVITDFYVIQDTLGEGTFGKVKSAIHILTGEKVL